MRDGVALGSAVVLAMPQVASLAFLVLAAFTKQVHVKGWRHVTPGIGYWLGAVLGGMLSLFIGYIWAFVGSTRSDAGFQMAIAWWLCLAFGIGGAWSCFRIWLIKWQSLRWRGSVVAYGDPNNKTQVKMQDLASHKRKFGGMTVFTFRDGTVLPVDSAATDGQNLCDQILAANGIGEIVPEH